MNAPEHPKSDFKAALIAGDAEWKAVAAKAPADALTHQEFSEIDLSNRDLAELDLHKSDFFRCVLVATNLKKSNLSEADLTHAKMARAALYKADLRGTILQEADLNGADLSAADCRGADFRGANLARVKFEGADLRGCDFSQADLTGATLTGANIEGAKFHFAQLSDANVMHVHYGTPRDMTGLYYGVRGLDGVYGNALFVRDARDQDYIDTLYQAILDKPEGFVRSLDLMLFRAWGLIDHGRSLLKVAAYAFVLAMLYGFLYLADMVYGFGIMDYSNSAQTWFTPFYYSVVTYTTLGFGDVTADSLLGEILVISEVIVGYFTLGLLLAILANTIARRS
ncbi:MAG: pentapeptide repeat-containing protein [Rhodobacteraceae bacterium]|nr:pentapeptide repeat-containing protein [Paracoccaceae bacterium]